MLDLHVGAQVFFRLSKDLTRYTASIISANDAHIVIRANEDLPQAVTKGEHLIISLPESDFYTEILNRENGMFSVKRLWCDRREYFRVDDVFPVLCKKVKKEAASIKTRMVSGVVPETPAHTIPDDAVHPRLWNMLVDINTKLGLILERLNLQSEGFRDAENKEVNLSASGLRVSSTEKAEVGDTIEVKMLLPSHPPAGIVAFGRVMRVEQRENGEFDFAIRFEGMEEHVRDEIIQYTLNRRNDLVKPQDRKER